MSLLARIGSTLLIPALGIAVSVSAQQKTARVASGEEVYEKVAASVVKITVLARDGSPLKTGSGVVINPEGDVVTNFHVVDGGTFFELSRSGKRAPISTPARPVSCAKQQDLALLRAASFEGLRPAKVSLALPRVGSRVFALGAPLSLESTFTDGIVSQIRRDGPQLLVQTTAPISHGSSGGGLFSEAGELFGITTEFMAGGQALNFAVSTQGLNELRPCSGFGEATLSAPTKSVGKFVTFENVKISLGQTKENILGRLGNRVRLESAYPGPKKEVFVVYKKGAEFNVLGNLRFEEGILTEAQQDCDSGQSQFALASALYNALHEIAPEGALSAKISVEAMKGMAKGIKGWLIRISGPGVAVDINMIDQEGHTSVVVGKWIWPDLTPGTGGL